MLTAALIGALAAVIGAAASGGAGDPLAHIYAQWKKGIRKHLKDETLRAEAKRILGEYRGDIETAHADIRADFEQLAAVNRDYDAKPEDYAAVIDRVHAHMEATQSVIIGRAEEVREVIGVEKYAEVREDFQREARKYENKQAKARARQEKKNARAAKNGDGEVDRQ